MVKRIILTLAEMALVFVAQILFQHGVGSRQPGIVALGLAGMAGAFAFISWDYHSRGMTRYWAGCLASMGMTWASLGLLVSLQVLDAPSGGPLFALGGALIAPFGYPLGYWAGLGGAVWIPEIWEKECD